LKIPADLLRRCFEHGAQTYPEEACGVLSGPQAQPDVLDGYHPFDNKLTRLHKVDPERYPRDGTNGYHMDPLAFMKLEKSLAAENRQMRVIYHSHPDCGAYFSEEDTSQALWEGEPRHPGLVYLVCGVKARQPDGAILAQYNPHTKKFDVTEVSNT